MADEADLAQANYEEFAAEREEKRKREREAQLKNLPKCENFIDCGSRTFVTDKGTICRFCRPCLAEYLADRNG